jgi:AraC-like DNA-binding protein
VYRLDAERQAIYMQRRVRTRLSPRSLRRRLAAENISYRELLDETRRALAEEMLADTRLSVAEIAELLGYAETVSFTHAFRRWTGHGPGHHRRTHDGGSTAGSDDPPPTSPHRHDARRPRPHHPDSGGWPRDAPPAPP